MMISYGRQHIDNIDIKSVTKALKDDLITTGSRVLKFENSLTISLHIVCVKYLKRHKKTCPKTGPFGDLKQVFPSFHCWRISTPHKGNMPHILQKREKSSKNTQNCHMCQL